MTAPALLVLAGGARDEASALTLQQLRHRIHELRETLHCQAAFVAPGLPSLGAAVRTLARQGYAEVVCVPLDCARLHAPSATMTLAVERVAEDHPDICFTVGEAVGAPGSLFSLLDQRLRDALSRGQSREIDSLLLLHDGSDDSSDAAQLARRARVWGAHHRLPVAVAGLNSESAVAAALASHAANGRRHVAVGWLSIFDQPLVRAMLEREPRIAAVAQPLGHDDAVIDAIVASYSVAALRSLLSESAVA